MKLDGNKKGTINVLGMGKDKSSVVVIPVSLSPSGNLFYSISIATFVQNQNQAQLPFEISKPLNQMNREELLSVLLRLIIYLLLQGKLVL